MKTEIETTTESAPKLSIGERLAKARKAEGISLSKASNSTKLKVAYLEALEDNNFEVFVVKNNEDAKKKVLDDLMPKIAPKSISWGGSMTFVATGLYNEIKDKPDFEVTDTYDQGLTKDEMMDRRRQALLVRALVLIAKRRNKHEL